MGRFASPFDSGLIQKVRLQAFHSKILTPMANTQLPAEASAELSQFIKNKIEIEREYWNNNPSADSDRAKTYVAGYGKGLSDGATEYAIKLHQAEQENKKAKDYLNLFLSSWVADLKMPEKLVNEIKTFLDGKLH